MTDLSHPLCRICLTAENRSFYNVYPYAQLMQDLGGISVEESEGFPQWLCSECVMLLKKSAGFKDKMLRAHSLLYEYVTRCAPFPVDGTDVELLKYASPQLSTTATLVCDFGRTRNGFHAVLQHVNGNVTKAECDVSVPDALAIPLKVTPFKDEPDFSDYEDNIPLDEYKHTIDKLSAVELSGLIQDGCQVKSELETDGYGRTDRKKPKKKRRDKSKHEYKRKRKLQQKEPKNPPKTIEKPIKPPKDDVDPNKIRVVHLDPLEQIADMKMESERDTFCKLKFKCKLCFKGFNYQAKLDNHMSKHSPSRGKFMCALCYIYLPTLNSYNVHMFIHTRRYECLQCGRRMIDRQSIIDHYRHQHEGLVTYYTCHYCGKVSSNNKTHRGHLRNHHGGSRPRCDLCDKTFVNKDSLTEHILIHEGIKNYECIKCNKSFRTKTQLKHHQLKHTDVKEFYCVECDVRFKSAHSLKQHLSKSAKHRDAQTLPVCGGRVQPPPRPAHRRPARPRRDTSAATPAHCCHTCGRTFSRASVLVAHARTHSGVRPHTCSRCSRTFVQRAALVTHVKLVHLHLKRTDKVKPEIINATLPDADSVRTQFFSKQHTDPDSLTAQQDKQSKNIPKISMDFKIENNIDLAQNMVQTTNNMVQLSNNMVQTTNNMVQPSNNMVQPSNNMVQPSNNMVQTTNNMVQPSNNMVQTTNNMVQPANKMVQTTNNMVQPANNMVQSANNMVRPSDDMAQPKLPVQSKIVLHNEKLSPVEMKIGKGICVDNKTKVYSKPPQMDENTTCNQPKEEMFDDDWRDNNGHQVYYYIHQ